MNNIETGKPLTVAEDLATEPAPRTAGAWVADRMSEPGTYQGISILAGLLGKWFLKDPVIGQQILEAGMALAGCIQVGKREAVSGRDY